MNKAEQTVLKILQATLNHSFYYGKCDMDWNAIYKELKNQSLLPLTYSWVKKQPEDVIDALVKNLWGQAFAAQSIRWYTMMKEQKELIRLFIENEHSLAVIKGCANGVYYPIPQVRGSGDIDFLVDWDSYDELYQLLINHEYDLIGKKRDTKHHVTFRKNGVVFEMHKRPGGTRIDGSIEQEELIKFFQSGLKSVDSINVCGYSIPVLPKLQNGMILLLHTAGHMKEGIGLRHLLDWMMYVKAELNDEFWLSHFEQIARKAQLDTFAKAMTKTCQKYLGLTKDITWCADISDTLCDQLIEYFLYQGDFGSKNSEDNQATKVFMESKTLAGFLSHLDQSSRYSFPASQKYIVLRPIAWIYQLYRYIRKGFKREHPYQTFIDNKKAGKERRQLFSDLGIE